ncbi:MAG: TOMM precursor leader peptide-binding protein [Thermoanaerobaculia bacterium]
MAALYLPAARRTGASSAPPSPLALRGLPEAIAGYLDDGSLAATLWLLDLETGRAEAHPLHREPDCPRCGGGEERDGPWRLARRPIGHRTDGGYRLEDPAVTALRLAPFVDRLTGVVRELALRPVDPGAARVAVATYPHPVPAARWADLRGRPRAAAAGKGASAAQATAGAVAEAIERSDGVFRGHEPRRLATAGELGDAALSAAEVLLYSDAQLASGEAAPLADDPPWRSGPQCARCAMACRYGHRLRPGDTRRRACTTRPTWNGCAAGRCREEAILQALLDDRTRRGRALVVQPPGAAGSRSRDRPTRRRARPRSGTRALLQLPRPDDGIRRVL